LFAIDAPVKSTRPADAEAKIVASLAFTNLVKTLRGYSNELGPLHENALRELLRDLSFMAHGLLKGRRVYPLACGLGKSQSVIALCAALHARGSTRSIAIAASRVEALCDLKRHLMKHGIPAESIGLLHSYGYKEEKREAALRGEADGYASEERTPEDEACQRQFLLVTHNKVYNGAPLEKFYYKGKPRSLVVWDEAIEISDCQTLEIGDLNMLLGAVERRIGKDVPVIRHLVQTVDALLAELKRQRDGHEVTLVTMPPLDGDTIQAYKAALVDVKNVKLGPLRQLLEWSQNPLRVTATGHGEGLVRYEVVVPDALQNIAVLDASFPISKLRKDTITYQFRPDPNIKRYDDVTLFHVKAGSGRGSVTREFQRMCDTAIEVVKKVPENEAVILWTFKRGETFQRGGNLNFKRELLEALRQSGIDTAATIPVSEGDDIVQKPRIVVRTWGQETSDSTYAYAAHSFFAGVMYRSQLDLAACLVGQKRDLEAAVDAKDVRDAMLHEAAQAIYQAVHRGSCRRMNDQQAMRHTFYLPVYDNEIVTVLADAMRGLRVRPLVSEHLTGDVLSNVVLAISEFLQGLPLDRNKVSVKEIKEALGDRAGALRTFTRALDEYLRRCDNWSKQGRSLVRTFDFRQ
jgi:hypothetical protein